MLHGDRDIYDGEDSWCEWQTAAAANTLDLFIHRYGAFSTDVTEALKLRFEHESIFAVVMNNLVCLSYESFFLNVTFKVREYYN